MKENNIFLFVSTKIRVLTVVSGQRHFHFKTVLILVMNAGGTVFDLVKKPQNQYRRI